LGNTFGEAGASGKEQNEEQGSHPAPVPLAACGNEIQVNHNPLPHFANIVGMAGVFPEAKGVKAKLIALLFRPGAFMLSFMEPILLCIGNGFEHQQYKMHHIQDNFSACKRAINLAVEVERQGKDENQYKLVGTDKKEVKDFKEQSVVYPVTKIFPAIIFSDKSLGPG